jgi:ankyrin repeat protein/mono/diheme cytochrome c family protein
MSSDIGHRRTSVARGWRLAVVGLAFAATLASAIALTVSAGPLSLIDAVKAGDVAAARSLLAKKADAAAAEADGTTALHWAVENDNDALVAMLLSAGAKAQVANRHGITPLHRAATNGNASIVNRLLAAGADANFATPAGDTPLMMAARTGKTAAIDALITKGAAVNTRETLRGQTALMWAASENNAAAIRVLVKAGADVHAKSASGMFTPLLFAVRGGHLDATRALLEVGADVNERLPDGMSALVLAVYNAHYELASALLEGGADPNAAAQGWTALHQIAWSRRPNRGFNMPGAVATGNLDSLELVRRLVARGADVNARMSKEPRDGNRNMLNRIGGTPFLMAAKSADVPLMRVLLESGADPKITTNDGTSPLMAAAGVGVYGPGESPGTAEEAFEAVKLAFEAGGNDVNAANKDGETALLGAVYRGGAVPVIQFLADKGARLDAENKKHWTPLVAAEGVVYASSGIRRYPEAAALIRKLMRERGLAIPEIEHIGGAAPVVKATALAANARTNWDGVYTDAQAQRGRDVYRRACAVCHLDTLEGDAVSPRLTGPAFLGRFNGQTAHEMVQAVRASMPQNAPDTLGDRAYVDLIAFLLNANGGRPGASELPLDVAELEKIVITAEQR